MSDVYSISLLSFNKNISLVNPNSTIVETPDVATVVKKFKEPDTNYTMITENNITDVELIFFSIPNDYNYNSKNITLLLDNDEDEGDTQISSLFFVINENNNNVSITKDIIPGILQNIIASVEYHVVLLYNIGTKKTLSYIQKNDGGLEEIQNFNENKSIKEKVNAGIEPSYSEQLNKDYKLFITNYLTPFLEKNNPKLITKLNDIIVNNTQINKETYFNLIFESYNEIIRHYDNLDKDHNIKKIFAINENQNNTINNIREYNPFNKKKLIKGEFREHEFSIYNLLYGFYNLYEYTKDISSNIEILNNYIKGNSQDFTNYIKKLEEKVNKSIITYVKINNTTKFDNNFRFKITPNETKTNMNVEYSFNNIKYYDDEYDVIKYKQVDSNDDDIISFVSETKENNNPLYSFKFNKRVEDIIYPNEVPTKREPLYPNISLRAGETGETGKTINASKQYTFGNFTKIFDVTQKNIDIVNQMQNITNLIINNNKPPPIFIVGYGSSGAGKTSNLIYFRNIDEPDESEDGILPNLCTKIIQEEKLDKSTVITLTLKTQEFYNNNSEKYSYKDDYKVFPTTTITYTFKYEKKKFILEKDTNIEIQHKYRFGFNFYQFKNGNKNKIDYIDYNDNDDKVFDPSGNDDGKKYFFKKGTPLGLVITFLVDIDRIVKATTNNPQSSRSHVLVYVDMMYAKMSKPKKVNLIVGDFAGIENEFNCGDPTTIETMHKQPNTLKDDELFYMDAIIPDKDSKNIDTIEGGAKLDIKFNSLNQPDPKIDVKIREYEEKYSPEIKNIIDEEIIKNVDNNFDNIKNSIENTLNTQKDYYFKKIKINEIYSTQILQIQTDLGIIGSNITKTQKQIDQIVFNGKFPETFINNYELLLKDGIFDKMNKILTIKTIQLLNDPNITTKSTKPPVGFLYDMTSFKIVKSDMFSIDESYKNIISICNTFKHNNEQIIEKIDKQPLLKINVNSNVDSALTGANNVNVGSIDSYTAEINDVNIQNIKSSSLFDNTVDNAKNNLKVHTFAVEYGKKYNVIYSISKIMSRIKEYNADVDSYNLELTDYNNSSKNLKDELIKYRDTLSLKQDELNNFIVNKNNEINNQVLNDDYTYNNNNRFIKTYVYLNNIIKDNDIQDYINYKVIKRNILNKACTNRLYEGYFINQSLKDLREAIQIIIQSKGFDIFYNYIDSCYSQYSPDELIYDETGIEKKIMKNIFIEKICRHITAIDDTATLTINNVKPIIEKMVICIYCVFNIAYKKNNPPTPTYYNINFLNMLSENNVTIQILTDETENFKKLEYVCRTYKEFNIDIFIESKIRIKIENIPTKLNEVVKFIYSNFKLINNAVKKDFFWKLIDQVRTTINIINSTSSMGSLEFIDQIAKLNTTSVVCTPETKQESISITDLFSTIESSLDEGLLLQSQAKEAAEEKLAKIREAKIAKIREEKRESESKS